MRIFHFRASIVTTRLNTLYPQFIGTFPVSTIFTVSAVFSSSPVLTVNTIFSVGTILSVNAILSVGTILTVNAILTIGTIFTICTNTGIFPINIPVPIGTDYYLWRSSSISLAAVRFPVCSMIFQLTVSSVLYRK